MTMAVCLHCGEIKFGAWTPCDDCAFTPKSVSAMSQALYLSDHNAGSHFLAIFANRIQNNLPWFIDDDMAAALAPDLSKPFDTSAPAWEHPSILTCESLRRHYLWHFYKPRMEQICQLQNVDEAQAEFDYLKGADSRLFPFEVRTLYIRQGGLLERFYRNQPAPPKWTLELPRLQ